MLFFSCSPQSIEPVKQALSIESYSPTFPILVGKMNNPVFRINVPIEAENATAEDIKINLKGTTKLADIESVSVFYAANSPAFSTQTLFGQSNQINKTLNIKGNQVLQKGTNYFWLSITLRKEADVGHKVAGKIDAIHIGGQEINVPIINNPQPKRLGHALRQHKDDGVHTYRIPGLATTNKGTLIAVYDVRRNKGVDLQEDVDVGMNRSTDGGQTWEPMKIIMDMGEWGGLPQKENGIGDPSILIDRQTGTIWVAALWLNGHPDKRAWWASKPGMQPQETGQFVLVKSEDDGLTWSEPINITDQIKNPAWHLLLQGPGKGIIMEDGTLVFPAQFKDEKEMPHATIIYSKDRGKTWKIGTGAKSNTTEAQVVELADHSLMLNMRDNRGGGEGKGTGARSVLITNDLGTTWTEHPTSRKALPEPVCMASLIKHRTKKGQDILIFSNPANQFKRKDMTIKISEDEGMNWEEKFHLLIDEGRGRGYSCMTSIDANTIGILYEGSQADLVFQKIDLREFWK
jgi:sialidase-1